MKIDEIRERFLKFFEARGHTIHPSDSLVPANDPSLLFTGAGMNQFKDMFLGRGTLPFKRATTSQKCLRTGDLENVGKTPAHHTFFEMLGNFSFGDYFKKEAIPWHWELVTKDLSIPAERLYASVYTDDDEAAEVWLNVVGLPKEKLRRFGADENFWPANAPTEGPNGPCGPCSEIHYDFGPKYGCGSEDCDVGCSCGRYVEIGNLVFTQFDRQDDGTLKPLPQKNIDTGTGLERLGAVLQGVHSNFDTDIFVPIVSAGRDILKLKKGESREARARLNRIADHIRALTFCIADNALPSNEGRGYVVRRILRTALRDGFKLGAKDAFLHKLVPAVIDVMKPCYPYIMDRRKTVRDIIKGEEEAFLKTLHRGTALLEEEIGRIRGKGERVVSGAFAFDLKDTHGFPIELTEDLAREGGMKVDREEYERLMKEKSEGTEAATSDQIVKKGAVEDLKAAKVPTTKFLGYGIKVAQLVRPVEAKILRIILLSEEEAGKFEKSKKDVLASTSLLNSGRTAEEAPRGARVAVLLDRTPFYADSGGQVGDRGSLAFKGGRIDVEDTRKPDDYFLHVGRVAEGTIRTGTKVRAQIDVERRLNIMRNHTGTHILQAGLRQVLGDRVEQSGSVVEPERLRFDFTHPKKMTSGEIRRVEEWCNHVILQGLPIDKREMTMEEAKKLGAIAFFGEKYGDRVRVVSIGEGVSRELCGGTHLEHTATIGLLKITSESSVQQGVRRIEAVTGAGAVHHARAHYDLIDEIAAALGCPKQDIPKKIGQIHSKLKELQQEVGRLRSGGGAKAEIDEILSGARDVNGEKIVVGRLDRKPDDLRRLLDQLIKKRNLAAALLASAAGKKPVFIIGVRKDLIKKGLKAGALAREIGRRSGGGGGGQDHMAQAGGSDEESIPQAMTDFEALVKEALK